MFSGSLHLCSYPADLAGQNDRLCVCSEIRLTTDLLSHWGGQKGEIWLSTPEQARGATLSREESDKVYERYHIPAPGRFVWAGPLANFTPGHQDTYVNFRNEERAPLLFIAGGEDNLMPPAVNQSNVWHYRHAKSVTEYREFFNRSHYTVGQDGWEEVADYALEWAEANAATRPAA